MTKRRGSRPQQCAVANCTNPATLIVMLEDYMPSATKRRGPDSGAPNFCEQDKSLPYICTSCAEKNEDESTNVGRSRRYPFSKWGARGYQVSGWTTYRDITTKKEVVI